MSRAHIPPLQLQERGVASATFQQRQGPAASGRASEEAEVLGGLSRCPERAEQRCLRARHAPTPKDAPALGGATLER